MTPGLTPARKAVLVDMAFELGAAGLAEFQKFLTGVRYGQWAVAKAELLNSRLFEQVPRRELENIEVLMTGQFPEGCDSARAYIRGHEGCELVAKPDAKGFWVIGWGHDVSPTAGPMFCSRAEADTWFEQDFCRAEAAARADLGPEYWDEETTI